ncbi:MAG: hypothetical protein JST82_01245 [Bacteroidetes bacterium]|nr:hypothetical protein [Bacteroidota bacterium]
MKNDLRPKLKIIFLPYLLISLTVISLFSFAKWFFEVKLRLLLLHSFIFDTVAASILTIILIITILRRRLHILDVRDKNGNLNYTGFYVFILISIVLPLNFAINYVGSATYQLKSVKTTDEIIAQPLTRYYAIDTLPLLIGNTSTSFSRYTSGKHNSTLNFDCYVAFPVPLQNEQVPSGQVWLTEYHHRSMRNSASDDVKDEAYRSFVDGCYSKINSVPAALTGPVYYDNVQDGSYRERIAGMVSTDGLLSERLVLLVPEYGSFENRAKGSGGYFLIAWLACTLAIFIGMMVSSYHERQLQEYYDKTLLHNDDIQKVVHYLHRHRYHPLALLLMVTVISLFVMWIWHYC